MARGLILVLLVFSAGCASQPERNSASVDDPRTRMIAWPEWTPTSVALLEQQENAGYTIVANSGGNAAAVPDSTAAAPPPATTSVVTITPPATVTPTSQPAAPPPQPSAGTSPQNPAPAAQSGTEYVDLGKNVSFSASADGSPPLSYQWRKNGQTMAGKTSAVLMINNAQASDAGTYDCIVKNPAGEATSPPVTLIVRTQ